MKRLGSQEGYDLYARDYRKDHPHLDSFMDGAETEAVFAALEALASDPGPAAPDRPLRLADVGCGDGRTLGRWVRRSAKKPWGPRVEFWGLDLSPKMLEAARGRIAGAQFAVVDLSSPASVDAWTAAHGRADLAAAFFVAVHLARLEDFFAGAARLLVPGGRLVMNTIPQPSAPELRAQGKPIVIEAFDHTADEVEAAGRQAGFVPLVRQDFEDKGQLVSTLFDWVLSAPDRS